MSIKSRIFGVIGLISTIIGFSGKAFYRDFINANGIYDYGIAGFLPSYFYVLGFSLLLLIRPAKHPIVDVVIVTIASIFYEIKQYFSSGLLDLPDIVASIGGGLTAILIIILIERKYSSEK